MKGIVSLSGGRDSSTLLAKVVKELGAENVYAISFEYGSKHPAELECAKKIAEYYGIKEHKIIEIDPSIFKGSTCTMLVGGSEVQKDKSYDQIIEENGEGAVDTYVPARNFLFSAYTCAYAESKAQETGDEVTYYLGQHADDIAGQAYPDCGPDFVNTMKTATEISSSHKVHTESPFINWHKSDIIQLAIELGVPLNYTLSCYDPIEFEKDGKKYVKECGRCATCIDVQKALKANGIEYKPTEIEIPVAVK